MEDHRAGVVSGLLSTSTRLGSAIGIAIAIASSQTERLVRSGYAKTPALAGGFHAALWVLGAIALLALPVIFAFIREGAPFSARNAMKETTPALTSAR